MLLRSTFRTIRKSLGRYLAILSIIALGVGFFAGLRISEESMIKTADSYVKELGLFDFRLISTLGFTEDDVIAFKALDGIKTAEGSLSTDFIYKNDSGADVVLHAHTLLEEINGVDIINGREPTSPDECILDAKYANNEDIGKKIRLSDSNPEEVSEKFSYKEYTVVGLCNASYYLNFERGTSSLGGGSVSGFVYLMPEGVNSDYYSELFIGLDCDSEIYSEEYNNIIESYRENIEALLNDRADIRFNKIYSDAKAPIDDAQNELEQKKKELEDAKELLKNGIEKHETERAETEKQLNDAQSILSRTRSELDASWRALNEAKSDPSYLIPAVKEQLDAVEAKLNSGEAEYSKSLADYNEALTQAQNAFIEAENDIEKTKAEISDAELKIAEAQEDIDDAKNSLGELKPANVFVLDRTSNVGYASFENDTAIVSGIAKVFPLFFFLVAALVCTTTMTRMVSEQRTENGVLKALGYGGGAIICQYFIYAGSASAAGCVIGFLIGSKFMPMALWQVYHIMYSIGRPVAFVLDWKLFFICTALYLICSLGATWLVCVRDLNESAAQLMRPKAPAAGKRVLLERIGFIWRHVRFLHKVSIRNILRYKKRMVMMIFGIGGCTALLLTGFGIRDTIKPVADNQFTKIDFYDASVSFIDPVDDDGKSKFLDTISELSSRVAFLHTEKSDAMLSDGKSKQINAVIFSEPLNDYVSLHRDEDPVQFPGEGEAVINYRFATENGIALNDILSLKCSDGDIIEVRISGIFDNYIYDYIYLSESTFVSQTGHTSDCNTAYILFNDGIDHHEAGAVILGADNVSNAQLSKDMRSRVESMLDSLDYIVLIVLVCAGALSFIVLYNLTNITITERTREIATLKVLGFYQSEQNSYVFRENIVLTGISALFGIPMGYALLRYVMSQIKISTMYFGCSLALLSYVYAVAITFLFTIIVDLALTFKTKKINMAEALKAIE
ncbi:MAG: FtsX-like permease family protein [Firmicutes bacterium]|nr:FtsX-like permease family protein [Bacillota bacterium]